MKISTLISPSDVVRIEARGGLISGNDVIVPYENRMGLLKSDDGQLLLQGEGYICESKERAREVFRQTARIGFEWDGSNHFHRLKVARKARVGESKIALTHGFRIYKDRIYAGDWLVLQRVRKAPKGQQYQAGTIRGGKLFLVGQDLFARIPEEAVGHCFCSQQWGSEPKNKYALVEA
jgi:hypothetical protein